MNELEWSTREQGNLQYASDNENNWKKQLGKVYLQ